MTFEEKKKIYDKVGIPYCNLTGNKFYKLQSLLCRITLAVRNKKNDNEISSYDILKTFFIPRNATEQEIAENLCVHCDFQMSIFGTEFESYGYNTFKEAKEEVIKLLNDYLPF